MSPYSVLMAFYHADDPENFRAALFSLETQTVHPQELVLVQDGPVSATLEQVVLDCIQRNPFPIHWLKLPKNQGLGKALALGLDACKYDLVGRMDADDISMNHRFEKQIQFMDAHPETVAVGSWVREFYSLPEDSFATKKAPCRAQVRKYARLRNPMNHPTVVFRKSRVVQSGNYRHYPGFEDFELWQRLLNQGAIIDNIQTPLLYFRRNSQFMLRRQGRFYSRNESAVFRLFRDQGYISQSDFILGFLLRKAVRLMPNWFAEFFYRKFLRR